MDRAPHRCNACITGSSPGPAGRPAVDATAATALCNQFCPRNKAVIVFESADIVFAVDSIPAIFAVADDPFIVYTSNVFAILGLRSLYFALADLIYRFHYLKFGLAIIMTFVGINMLLMDIYKIPVGFSLAFIFGVIVVAIVASMRYGPDQQSSGALKEE